MDEFHIDNKILVLSYPDDIAQAGVWSGWFTTISISYSDDTRTTMHEIAGIFEFLKLAMAICFLWTAVYKTFVFSILLPKQNPFYSRRYLRPVVQERVLLSVSICCVQNTLIAIFSDTVSSTELITWYIHTHSAYPSYSLVLLFLFPFI